MNHGLFAPIEKIKKHAKNLQSTNSSPPIPTSPLPLTSFLSKRNANRLSFASRKNSSFGSRKLDKSKYANAFEPTTNKSLTYQRSSHFDNENKLVESIQSNLEKINSLKEIIKYNNQQQQHANNSTTLCITKANKLLKTSANTIRSKSTPQKLLNSEKRRKLFAKSSQNDIYKSLLLSQQSKMILNQLNADKNATNPSGHASGSGSSSALNNFKNLITYSSSSSTSNSSSTSTSTSTSINYSGKKPVDSPGKKSSLLSLKNFHLKIPKFSNSSSNGTSSAENSKSTVTQPIGGASCANSEEKVSSNLELAKSKDLTGMCRQ